MRFYSNLTPALIHNSKYTYSILFLLKLYFIDDTLWIIPVCQENFSKSFSGVIQAINQVFSCQNKNKYNCMEVKWQIINVP